MSYKSCRILIRITFKIVRSKFVKRKKVVPVEYNPNSDIDIEEFYRDAQNEEIDNVIDQAEKKIFGIMQGKNQKG